MCCCDPGRCADPVSVLRYEWNGNERTSSVDGAEVVQDLWEMREAQHRKKTGRMAPFAGSSRPPVRIARVIWHVAGYSNSNGTVRCARAVKDGVFFCIGMPYSHQVSPCLDSSYPTCLRERLPCSTAPSSRPLMVCPCVHVAPSTTAAA